jgi:CRP/FNR family transcriptional regulator, cyclic AMP receptor protein
MLRQSVALVASAPAKRGSRATFCAGVAMLRVSPPGDPAIRGAMTKPPPQSDNLLSALSADLLSGLFAKGRVLSLAPDQTLFLPGDPPDGCYRVDEGLLKVSVSTAAGNERILAILGAGAMIGELAMIDGAPRSASVTALRESKLCFVSRAAFDTFAHSHPDIYRHGMIVLAKRLRETNDALAATTFMSLRGRVAGALLSLVEAFGHDVGGGRIVVRQKVTQSDLAAMAGIARENVSRILSDWMRRSIVSRHAGYHCVENKEALKREADG